MIASDDFPRKNGSNFFSYIDLARDNVQVGMMTEAAFVFIEIIPPMTTSRLSMLKSYSRVAIYTQRESVSRFFQPHIRTSFIFFFGHLFPISSRKKKNETCSESVTVKHRKPIPVGYNSNFPSFMRGAYRFGR
jgi:hypothetical protein